MKVCIFTASIDKKDGGPSRSTPILAKGLSLVGVETTLMSLSTDDMNTHLLDGSQVDIVKVNRNYNSDSLERLLLEGQYDLIHGQNLWDPFYHNMARITRKHGIPYIVTPRGCLEPWAYKGQGFIRNMKKKIAMLLYQKNDLDKANCILATAEMEANNIRALGITAPIAVIPNGIDVSEYKCRSLEEKANVKKQIVFLSRIHQKKGIEFLINAWENLKTSYPDWKVVIAGNGDEAYIKRLRSLILSKDMQDCVSIIPPVFGADKHKLYCESSLFVLPTYSENFGMVIAEAMSCGVPVITTTGTPWQELNEKHLGWCIELSLNNLMTTLSSAIDLGQECLFNMGQECSKYIFETYQYTEVAEKNKAVYEWIVGGADKPNYVV